MLAAVVCRATELAISRHPQRELILKNLQLLADDVGKEDANHFFAHRIGGQDWIFWREGRLLISTSFEVAVGDQEITADQIWGLRIRYCRKPIKLDSGVVPTRAHLPPGTTFHVTRDFVAGIVYECVLNGEMVVVQKRPNAEDSAAPERAGVSR
jgi:hypothetical protein